jgi:hypothetical protein
MSVLNFFVFTQRQVRREKSALNYKKLLKAMKVGKRAHSTDLLSQP